MLDSREKYMRFTGRLCVVTGVVLLALASALAVSGQWASAALWFVAGVVLIAWGSWRLRSARR
ncbi:MAG TPA: hypothetical protein VMH39_09540 [Gemmatimonadaceae bacterium]|nr:hypothetical protein [Gemmatimonadaceae bacterium]